VPSLALCLGLSAVWFGGCQSRTESQGDQSQAPSAASAPDHLPPLDHLPIDPPIRITATFGEYRRAHFHAGVDFSTDLRVGRPVYAPVNGYVERVGTSGTGFGNSLRLHAQDGRTILLAHLDGFDEPIASYAAAVQESSGHYEQDLVPSADRLPVHAGQRIAWSGQSGVGPPHLHMEIRWGEVAYNPLRFGLSLPDSHPPLLHRVTLEPVDDTSYVAGSAAPRTFALGPRADTVVIQGRARAWLDAADGVSEAWARVAPYTESIDWNGEQVESRFDRISWETDMPDVEWAYDATGRSALGQALALWIADEYRPSMYKASRGAAGGVVTVRPGDPPRPLTLRAGDAAGNTTERQLVLRPPREGEHLSPLPRRRRAAAARGFDMMPLAGPFVRLRYSGAPPGLRDVALGLEGKSTALRPATFDGARWVAVVRVPLGASLFVATGRTAAGTWEARVPARLVAVSPQSEAVLAREDSTAAFRLVLPSESVFIPTFLVVDSLRPARGTPSLATIGSAFSVEPSSLPLRRPARIEATLRSGGSERHGLYHLRGASWIGVNTPRDSAASNRGAVSAQVRTLGRFAVFEDVAAPRIAAARTARISTPALQRWALQCRVVEGGSGVDAERSYFEVDGRRVPTEYDLERGILRWRPLHPPAAGTHAYRVIAVDRAGNESQATGRFVAR